MRSYLVTSFGSTIVGIRSSVCTSHNLGDDWDDINEGTVASKCGFDCFETSGGGVTNSAAHIKEYIEGTIERLGFAPDLYYLHRIDPSR